MRVEAAAADEVAAGRRHLGAAEAREQRAGEQERRPDPLGELGARSRRRATSAAHSASSFGPRQSACDADAREDREHRVDVADPRDVAEHDLLVGEHGGGEDRERAVLVPGRHDRAGERRAAFDDELLHQRGSPAPSRGSTMGPCACLESVTVIFLAPEVRGPRRSPFTARCGHAPRPCLPRPSSAVQSALQRFAAGYRCAEPNAPLAAPQAHVCSCRIRPVAHLPLRTHVPHTEDIRDPAARVRCARAAALLPAARGRPRVDWEVDREPAQPSHPHRAALTGRPMRLAARAASRRHGLRVRRSASRRSQAPRRSARCSATNPGRLRAQPRRTKSRARSRIASARAAEAWSRTPSAAAASAVGHASTKRAALAAARMRAHVKKNRRRPTLPGPCEPSTIGAEGLNCSVRNGKRCFPLAKATGKGERPHLGGPSKLHSATSG